MSGIYIGKHPIILDYSTFGLLKNIEIILSILKAKFYLLPAIFLFREPNLLLRWALQLQEVRRTAVLGMEGIKQWCIRQLSSH